MRIRFIHKFHQFVFNNILAISILIVLSSCSGSGSDEVPVLDDDINGVWRDSSGSIGIISYNGSFVNIVGPVVQFVGDMRSRDGDIYESTLTGFGASGDMGSIYFLENGSAIPKERINANYCSSSCDSIYSSNFTFDLLYDSSLTERTASINLISGLWNYALRDYIFTLTINKEGGMSGTDTNGCVYSGTISIPDASINTYKINLTVSGCYSPGGSAYGQAILMDSTNFNDTLLLAARTHNKSILFQLTRQ
jgi:hypothetical protein